MVNFIDKGFIDLDFVEREPLKIAQRRVSRSKVIKRDLNARCVQLMER